MVLTTTNGLGYNKRFPLTEGPYWAVVGAWYRNAARWIPILPLARNKGSRNVVSAERHLKIMQGNANSVMVGKLCLYFVLVTSRAGECFLEG